MSTASKLLAMFVVSSSLSVAAAQTPAETPGLPTPQTSPDGQITDQDMQNMHIALLNLEEQMAKIRSTSDPAERERLMMEHMSMIRDVMSRIRAAMSTMIKMGGGSLITGRTSAAGSPPPDMRMMEQYTEMLQSMLDQMMQHVDMMNPRK